MSKSPYLTLYGERSTLIVKAEPGKNPMLVYWGNRLNQQADIAAVEKLRARQGAPGVASLEVPITLSCEPGSGYLGPLRF